MFPSTPHAPPPTLAFLVATLLASTTTSTPLPAPSGPYNIGYTQHVFTHTTPNDPTPGPGTQLLASLYYPTRSTPSPNNSVPYFDATSAGIWGAVFNIAASDLLSLTTSLQWQAPPLTPADAAASNVSALPTLLFGIGGGMNSFMYSSLLSDLASQGYTVVTYDHPGEAPYLLYPSGEGVVGFDIDMPYDAALIQAMYEFRRDDMLFLFSDAGFPSWVKQQHGGAYFNTARYGAFGHSNGAAAALAAMDRLEESVVGGINLDGGLFGDSVDAKLKGRPCLMVMNEVHNASDPTWPGFVERYEKEADEMGKGWMDWVTVNGARHLAFSDIPLWIELLPQANGTNQVNLGTVKGSRMDRLVKKYVGSFWGWVSGGAYDKVLDGAVEEWPEVVYNETVRRG